MIFTGRFGQGYFNPSVSFANDVFVVECESSTVSVAAGSECRVQYTTEPLYTELSEQLNTTLDAPLEITGLNASVTYYFEFSLLVDNSLSVVEQNSFTVQPGESVNRFITELL